ncbi:hypothetical protein K8T06_12975, partial [bacterium]|nr:hypothetical protein [bacterium]
ATIMFAGCIIPLSQKKYSNNGVTSSQFIKNIGKNLLYLFMGFGLVTLVLLSWIVLFDSIDGFYRQCIRWPAEYRGLCVPSVTEILSLAKLLNKAYLDILLLITFFGLLKGWLKGPRRLAILTSIFLVSELFRITFEGALWPYTLTSTVMPMLIGASLLLINGNISKQPSLLIVTIPLFCLIPMLFITASAEEQAFKYRILKQMPSPYEHLATQMRATGYQQGDSIYVESNDYQIILLLKAPRPYPILSFHYDTTSEMEKFATKQYYIKHTPLWVVKDSSPSQLPKLRTKGGRDYAYHIVFVPENSSNLISNSTEKNGAFLSQLLPTSVKYRKVINTGNLEAWRLLEIKLSTNKLSRISNKLDCLKEN